MSDAVRDRGSIVVGWFAKIVVVMAVVAIAMFDGISVGVAHMNGSDDANMAASAANFEWTQTHNVDDAYKAAVDAVTNGNEKVLTNGFSIDADGTVHLLLRRTAVTLAMSKIGPLKKYTVFTVRGEATTATP
jgi:negative regulator of sigma E activity